MRRAVLIDIDNTLVSVAAVFKDAKDVDKMQMEERLTYFYNNIEKGTPINWCLNLVKLIEAEGYYVVFLTGRNELSRLKTEKQLKSLGFTDYELVMRPANDPRVKDEDVKRDALKELVKKYSFAFAIDDRWQNCKVYTEDFGIPSLVVYYPEEERH